MQAKLAALIAMGADMPAHIANLDTALSQIETPAGPLPLTRNDGSPTCYINCPSVAYLDYAIAELRHFEATPLLKSSLAGLITMARPLMAWSGLDRQVQPNNWLLSTNPMPSFTPAQITTLTNDLTRATPGHAIVWRSLNDFSDAQTLKAFAEAGYLLLPARQIYLFDARTTPPPLHRDEKRDRQLLAGSDYTIVGPDEITANDAQRIAALYGQLYLDKYTWLNPQYTPAFIASSRASGLIQFHGLRSGLGQLDAVIGFFDIGHTMTAPIVGYDTSLPATAGLYRRLMAIALQRARNRGMLFNMSAGAASFKRHRGAVAALEYTAVYARHLPPLQRTAIGVVRAVLDSVGIAVLRRFSL